MADETTDLLAELEGLRLDLVAALAARDNAVRDWLALLADLEVARSDRDGLRAEMERLRATVKPDREEVALKFCLMQDSIEHMEQTDDAPCSRCLAWADAVLALWPGRTEPEVKDEALREAADRYRKVGESGYLFLEGVPVPWAVVASDLDRLAAELREKA